MVFKKKICSNLCFLGFIFLTFSISILNADEKKGRLPDGRAYRTDKEGNQLVDYIAEIELNSDGLNRKIQALEQDIEEKNKLIDRLSNGKSVPAEVAVSEKDIIKQSKNEQKNIKLESSKTERSQNAKLENTQSEIANKEIQCKEIQGNENQKDIQLISKQKTQIEDINTLLKEKEKNIINLKASIDSLQNDLLAQKQKNKDFIIQIDSDAKIINSLQQKIDVMNINDAKKEEKHKAQQATLALNPVEIKPVEVKQINVEKINAQIKPINKEIAEMRLPIRVNASTSQPESNALSSTRQRAVESLKGSMNTQINQLQGLIAKRNSQFSKSASQNSSIRFKPSEASTDEGENIASISKRIANATTVNELSFATKDISEIKAKVEDDLAFILKYIH